VGAGRGAPDVGLVSFPKLQRAGFEYNSLGKVTRKTDPLGRAAIYNSYANGIDLQEIRQVNGQNTELLRSFTYNTQHQPLTVTDAAGQTTTYTYNAAGQVLTITTPPRAGISENRTTTYTYDTNGYLQTVTGPVTGATTTYTYDGYGRIRTAADSESYAVTYDYDALDRPTKATYPDGTYHQTVYNRLDPEQLRDRNGNWTHIFNDALRRVVAVRDALGNTTTGQWCTCGSLDKIIDANGNAISWERDLQGRVTKETRADSSFSQYAYESTTSRVKQRVDRKNQTTTYEYFLDNLPKQVTYTGGSVSTPTVTYAYDSVYSRLVTASDGTGTTTWAYNPITTTPSLGAGLLATIDGPLSNDTIAYTYDERGRLVGHAVNSVASSWTYDVLGRITTESNPLGSFTFGYVGTTSRLASATYPNGQTTAYTYFDNLGHHRLQEIKHLTPAAAGLSKFNYAYDGEGRITSWSQQRDSDPARVLSLSYDPVGELLTAARAPADPSAPDRFAYAYDKVGNRTAEQLDDAVTGGTYNTLNQLVSTQAGGALLFRGSLNEPATVTVAGAPAAVGPTNTFQGTATVPSGTSNVVVSATDPSGNTRTNTYQVSQSGTGKNLTYDLNGNLTGDGTRSFEWDIENRLVAVNQGTLRSEFTYKGNGERVRIVEKDNSVVVSDQRFVWCESDICEERDGTGSSVTHRFYGLGMQEGGVAYFYTHDHLGSLREMTDTTGALRARYEYDPYGRTTKVGGDKTAVFGFTGHLMHAPSGLAFAKRRAYDATLGRWISEDPIGLKGGINFYRYVLGDPVDNKDPSGLRLRKCARVSDPPLGFTSHVYICDPDTGRNCGLNGDPDFNWPPWYGPMFVLRPKPKLNEPVCESGPGVRCVDIPGSEDPDKEKKYFDCCENPPGTIPLSPSNSCHEYADNCLKSAGLKPPASPLPKYSRCNECPEPNPQPAPPPPPPPGK